MNYSDSQIQSEVDTTIVTKFDAYHTVELVVFETEYIVKKILKIRIVHVIFRKE